MVRPLIKPAVKAWASAGLRFGVEKALKKIFGKGYRTNEIKPYKLRFRLWHHNRKRPCTDDYLVGKERSEAAIQPNTLDFSEI